MALVDGLHCCRCRSTSIPITTPPITAGVSTSTRTTSLTMLLQWPSTIPRFNGNNMETYTALYDELCSYENLELAWRKCRKHKTLKNYVIGFESDLENNLQNLKYELESFTYLPHPMTNFIVRDPKTRKISASHFRDRIVYHAICNIIAPIFEKQFIHDSFANQIAKGTRSANTAFATTGLKSGQIITLYLPVAYKLNLSDAQSLDLLNGTKIYYYDWGNIWAQYTLSGSNTVYLVDMGSVSTST